MEVQLVLGLGFSARVVEAVVFLECFLRETVEGERGKGAFQARRYYAPGAVRTTPASEFVIFEPDHAGWHTYTFARSVSDQIRCDGWTAEVSSVGVNSCPLL